MELDPRRRVPMAVRLLSIWLRCIQTWDRFRLRRLMARHAGLEIHPTASSNLASAKFELAAGARLRIAGADPQQRGRP